ncbi:MAG: hypothetical protein Q7T78_17080 [Rhodoferax sp.]|nr:hypothetical protein [Rhodoferax sp.]
MKKKQGICALTKKSGTFVKSHIIPRALTLLPDNGKKRIEMGIGEGIKHRFESWYDDELCSREGEDILAVIDSKGIEILRRHTLVWSGWETGKQFLVDPSERDKPVLMKDFDESELKALRLFFISIVWRAGASKRDEFRDVKLTDEELALLRQKILDGDPGEISDFPIILHQLTTKGFDHNRTPLLETAHMLGEDYPAVEYLRIYFDGLVSIVVLPRRLPLHDFFSKMALGAGKTAVIFTRPFEDSRTEDDIEIMVKTVLKQQYVLNLPKNPINAAIGVLWSK